MKFISTSFIVLIALLSLTVNVQAQGSISFDNDTVMVTEPADTVEIVAYNELTNNSSDTVNVVWERTVNNYDPMWSGTSICDNELCWAPSVSSRTITILPNRASTMDVHFLIDMMEGEGEVHIRAYVVDDSANTVVEAVYFGDAQMVSSSANTPEQPEIQIFPNPANDFIYIRNLPETSNSQVEVYNILGKKMLDFNVQAGQSVAGAVRFDLSSIPKGIYMIRVYDQSMNLLESKSITKGKS